MKVLVVYAHPDPDSFNAAIHEQVCSELQQAGHEVHDLDLYREKFQASMSREEREKYMTQENVRGIENQVARLRWADALVFVYPTWWMGPPAILKGWFDRVWLPGVAATFANGVVEPGLTNIKKIMVITTQGSSRWRMFAIGNPPKKMFKLSLKACTRCRDIQWLALYSMDKNTDLQRKHFLEKVRSRIKAIR
ncbi:MAG: NAD(P)H-dependent oxidoreductase [Endozoicomonas sp.]